MSDALNLARVLVVGGQFGYRARDGRSGCGVAGRPILADHFEDRGKFKPI